MDKNGYRGKAENGGGIREVFGGHKHARHNEIPHVSVVQIADAISLYI